MELSNLFVVMTNNLTKLYEQGIFENKEVILFGLNKQTEKTIDFLRDKNIEVLAIVDNNKNKAGGYLSGTIINTPDYYLENYREDVVILIASYYYIEMVNQLEKWGYKENVHIFQTYSFKNFDSTQSVFFEKKELTLKGFKLYNEIVEKYGEDTSLIICPYHGTGDAIVVADYLHNYIENNKIEKYVFVMAGGVNDKIVNMYDVQNFLKLTQEEILSLLYFYRIIDKEIKRNIYLIDDTHVATSLLIISNDGTYLTWGKKFLRGCLEVKENQTYRLPKAEYRYENNKEYLDKYFDENGLVEGKTVIFAPYAQTLLNMNEEFTIKLVEKLKEKGFVVFTNSPIPTEPPIRGTIGLNFPITQASNIVQKCGYFIGARSGFCDVVALSNAKKVIVYQRECDIYFSLKELGEDYEKNLKEIMYNDDYEKIIDAILEYFGE